MNRMNSDICCDSYFTPTILLSHLSSIHVMTLLLTCHPLPFPTGPPFLFYSHFNLAPKFPIPNF